jgi:hypothetical protein
MMPTAYEFMPNNSTIHRVRKGGIRHHQKRSQVEKKERGLKRFGSCQRSCGLIGVFHNNPPYFVLTEYPAPI